MLDSFTAGERRVVIIVAMVIVAAYGIQWLNGYRSAPQQIDYSASDSIFYSRSKMTPFQPAKEKPAPETRSVKADNAPIAINVATKEELMRLPGIGPAMAERIIRWRTQHGSFSSTGQLIEVKGIGPKTLKKLLPFISLN